MASWRRAANPVVDFGREIYKAWRISTGDTLYSDVASIFGPLGDYATALVMGLFGPTLTTVFLLNILLIGATTTLIFLFIRHLSDLTTSVMASLLFLSVFAFAHPDGSASYNFVAPYSLNAIWGLLISIGGCWALVKWATTESRICWAGLAGLLFGLTLLTKPEFPVALAGPVAATAFHRFWLDPVTPEGRSSEFGSFLLGVASPLLLTMIFFSITASPSVGLEAVTGAFRPMLNISRSQDHFYSALAGLSDPIANLGEMALHVGLLGAIVSLAVLTDWVSARFSQWLRVSVWIGSGVLAVIAMDHWGLHRDFAYGIVPKSLPAVLAAAAVAVGIASTRSQSGRNPGMRSKREWGFFIWLVFASLLMLKQGLNPRFTHYGFVLAAPGAIAFAVLCIHRLPRIVENQTGHIPYLRLFGISMIAIVIIPYGRDSLYQYRLKTNVVGSGADVLYDRGTWGEGLDRSVQILRSSTRPEGTLAVIPEGAIANYWLRRKSTLPWTSYLPAELDYYGSERMVRALRARPPHHVIVWPRTLTEYGLRRFGDTVASGREILDSLARDYVCVAKVEVNGDGLPFFILSLSSISTTASRTGPDSIRSPLPENCSPDWRLHFSDVSGSPLH